MLKAKPIFNNKTQRVIHVASSPVAAPVSNQELKKHTEITTGEIAKQIGTGDNARDSFVWMTLRACFWIAGLSSVSIFIMYLVAFLHSGAYQEKEFVTSLKDLWSIFTPIITLALGYAFGKRENR
ncbi:hypothetical protein [Leclercia adecarboxylata]|uniref:hypothetical protein n=1 Tax=Leclercia adecarboxylata TaxID=83655 RepID=UPI0011A08AA3|nr:hypothetical protein [Leclercia adecarboxylata]